MNVLLVDNLVMPEDGDLAQLDVHPHLGLLALAGVADAAGHRTTIYDPKRMLRDGALPLDATLYEHAAAEMLRQDPDVVGFTALGASFLFAANVARRLKAARPALPILLGGPHATMLDRAILEAFPQFDVIARHEADETFPALLEALPRGAIGHIAGLSWRDAAGAIHASAGAPKIEDLDSLPLARYDLYPIAALDLPLLRIEAGRGCPFACTFCSTVGFFQRSYRLKSPARLVAELDRLNAAYGATHFKLDHDMFTASRRKILAFCEAVRGRGYRWRVSARVDCVDPELLEAMAAAGCVGLYFGIETGSERLQAITAKRLDLALVLPVLRQCEALGIETTASFICGFPEETEADLAATLALIGRCLEVATCLTQLHMLAPEPGTPLFAAHGGTIRLDDYTAPYHCGILDAADAALVRDHPAIFQTYYHYPTALRPRQRFAVAAVDLMRRLGPVLGDYLLRFFEGRLDALVARLGAACAWQAPDAAALVALLAGTLGQDHHAVSLVRYATAGGGALDPRDGNLAEGFDPARCYRLDASAVLLDRIHDCGALIDAIAALAPGETLPPLRDGAASAYLALATPQGARRWRCDPGVVALASLFAEGARPCDLVARAGLPRAATYRLVEDLAHLGVLRAEREDVLAAA